MKSSENWFPSVESWYVCVRDPLPTVRITAAHWRWLLTPALTADDSWLGLTCWQLCVLCPCACETGNDSFLFVWGETRNLFVWGLYQVPEFTLKYVWAWQWHNNFWRCINMCLLSIDECVQLHECVWAACYCVMCLFYVSVCLYYCRYTAVAMPMLYNTRYSSRRRVAVMIAVVWFLSFAISCPLLFGLNNTGNGAVWSLLSSYSTLTSLGVVRKIQASTVQKVVQWNLVTHFYKTGGVNSVFPRIFFSSSVVVRAQSPQS